MSKRRGGVADVPAMSLDSAPDAIVVTSPDGTVLQINQRAEDLFGYCREELSGKPLGALIPAGLASSTLEAGSMQRTSRTVVCAHRDGTRFFGTMRWGSVPTEHGDVVVLSMRELGGERLAAGGAAFTSDAPIELLSLFAHDVRESLQSVRYLCESVRDRAPFEADTASEIIGSVCRLLDRVSRVVPGGTLEPLVESCRVGPLLGTLARELTPLAARKGLQLSVEEAPDATLTDPVLFRELLHNLLVNAIRYTHVGAIRVRCCADEDKIRVEITDTGVGMTSDQLAALAIQGNIRSRFRDHVADAGAANALRSRDGGLGLAIVHHLARLLDCTIEVDSAPGRGSCFVVSAPRDRAVQVPCSKS